MKITIVVQGSLDNATNECTTRGLEVTHVDSSLKDKVILDIQDKVQNDPKSTLIELQMWFNESSVPPFEDGALLFFSVDKREQRI